MTTNDRTVWDLARKSWATLGPHFMPIFERLSAESGLDLPTWGLLLAALTFEPETITPGRLQVRGPYTAADDYLARLATAAETGHLGEVAPGEYSLTKAGRTEAQRSIEEVRTAMALSLIHISEPTRPY